MRSSWHAAAAVVSVLVLVADAVEPATPNHCSCNKQKLQVGGLTTDVYYEAAGIPVTYSRSTHTVGQHNKPPAAAAYAAAAAEALPLTGYSIVCSLP
jgi:hypothetical protein